MTLCPSTHEHVVWHCSHLVHFLLIFFFFFFIHWLLFFSHLSPLLILCHMSYCPVTLVTLSPVSLAPSLPLRLWQISLPPSLWDTLPSLPGLGVWRDFASWFWDVPFHTPHLMPLPLFNFDFFMVYFFLLFFCWPPFFPHSAQGPLSLTSPCRGSPLFLNPHVQLSCHLTWFVFYSLLFPHWPLPFLHSCIFIHIGRCTAASCMTPVLGSHLRWVVLLTPCPSLLTLPPSHLQMLGGPPPSS